MKKKKCKSCGVEFTPTKPIQAVCGYSCALKYGKKIIAERQQKKVNAERKQFNYNNMTLSDWKKKVQVVFNKFIRLRDLNKGCISCGTTLLGKKYDAGHFYATTYEGLRFNELNVHGQCVQCNRDKHGNIHEYRKKIVERIGVEGLDWLDNNRYLKLKLSKYELEELFEIYKQKIKEHEAI